jgi:hypothetical protein
MSAHEVTMYQVKCDCCGEIETDYGDYSACGEIGYARECASATGWVEMGDLGNEIDLCNACWCWPEDLPDYPGDDLWEGSDDPVRKPGCHDSEGRES